MLGEEHLPDDVDVAGRLVQEVLRQAAEQCLRQCAAAVAAEYQQFDIVAFQARLQATQDAALLYRVAEGRAFGRQVLLFVLKQLVDQRLLRGFQLSSLLLMNSAPPGMIGLTRLFIEPGQTRQLSLPRLEGAKMVGIAAGYAHLDPTRSVKLYQIGVDVTSTGFFSKTWTATPRPIAIDLLVGPDALLRGRETRQ